MIKDKGISTETQMNSTMHCAMALTHTVQRPISLICPLTLAVHTAIHHLDGMQCMTFVGNIDVDKHDSHDKFSALARHVILNRDDMKNGEWKMCDMTTGTEPDHYEEPDLPSDPCLQVAISALEAYAIDKTKPPHKRQLARIYQYVIGDSSVASLEEWKDSEMYELLYDGAAILGDGRSGNERLWLGQLVAHLRSAEQMR